MSDIHFIITCPADNIRGPQYADQALAAIHQGNTRRLPFTLGLGCQAGQVALFCDLSDELSSLSRSQLYGSYPEAKIENVAIPREIEEPRAEVTWSTELTLHADLFPIKRYPQFEDSLNRVSADPLTALLSSLRSGEDGSLRPRIEITVRPARPRLAIRYRRHLRTLATPFFRSHDRLSHAYLVLATSRFSCLRIIGFLLGRVGRTRHAHEDAALHISGTRQHDREEDLQAAADKLGRLLFETRIQLTVSGPQSAEERAKAKLREMAGAFGQFSSSRLAAFRMGRIHREKKLRLRATSHRFLLSTEELATLWHLPTSTVRAETMATVESRECEPPVELPTPQKQTDIAVLGLATFRGRHRKFGILRDDRRRHVALLGKTGMGKSTLLHHLIVSDISAGRGCALIDPHGDLADAVLAAVPSHRANDVVLFDAGDSAHPLSFNMLACPRTAQRALIASGIVSAFKKLYADSWGPRLEHILRNALLALLEAPGSTLLTLLRLLSDRRFRERLTAGIGDPVVRAFWEQEFVHLPRKLQIEAVAPIQNKVGHFVSNPLLRNILGQSRSSFDLRRVMDDGKVLLVNLSKGRLGDDASQLLGSFLVSAVQLAAMSRADTPEEHRRDFYLYVDEFQNFATNSFAEILSEARKYRLNLCVANQYLAQVDEATLSALLGNIGTLVTFQVGAQDSEILAEELGGDLQPRDLLRLPRYQAYVRLLIEGHPSRPFSMQTLPPTPFKQKGNRAEAIRRSSRQRYARPVTVVNQEIATALAT